MSCTFVRTSSSWLFKCGKYENCTCGKYDIEFFSCRHVIPTILSRGMEIDQFIDELYPTTS